MKKALSLSFASIALFVSLAARAQTPNPLYKYLPANADHITEINYNQINSKGNLGTVLNALPPMNDPKADLIVGMLKDPGSVGVDLSHNILMASVTANGEGADTLNFTSIIIQLSDSAKFRSAFTTAFHGLHLHRMAGLGTSTSSAKDKLGIAWNDHVVIVTTYTRDAFSMFNKKAAPAAGVHRTGAEIAAEKSLAALKGVAASPWLTDQRFLTGFATDEDVHFWSTGLNFRKAMSKVFSKIAQSDPKMKQMEAMLKASSNYPKPKVLSTFNFGNGKIQFHMTYITTPEYAATMKEFFDRPFDKDLLARVPDGMMLGFAAVHFNLSAVGSLMEKYHTRGMIDSLLGKAGLTLNDITAPFTGDMMVAAVATDSTITADSAKKKVKIYFAAGIKDPAALMTLGAKVAGKLPLNSLDSSKANKFKNLKDKILIKDNMIVISSTKEDAEKYVANQNRRSTDLLGENNAIMKVVIDLKAVGSLVGSSMSGNPKMMIAARLLDRLDKIIFTNGVMDGDTMVSDFQITTGDPNTNSLATLLGIMH